MGHVKLIIIWFFFLLEKTIAMLRYFFFYIKKIDLTRNVARAKNLVTPNIGPTKIHVFKLC